eukprot:883715-Rhodomonas_salina.2
MKNFITSIINQKPSDADAGGRLVDKEVLYEVAGRDLSSEVNRMVRQVLEDKHHKMDLVPLAILFNAEFITSLREAGHEGAALVLETFGYVLDAFDKRCMTSETRVLYGLRFTALFQSVFSKVWWTSQALPKTVMGIPTTVWMAIKRNVDSMSYLRADGRSTALDIVDRYVGTYDIEGSFSALVQEVGYKPVARLALGVMHRCFRLLTLRHMDGRGFTVMVPRKARYNQGQDNMSKGKSCGWGVGDCDEGDQGGASKKQKTSNAEHLGHLSAAHNNAIHKVSRVGGIQREKTRVTGAQD